MMEADTDGMKTLATICRLSENMRVDGVDAAFWAGIFEPVASILVKAGKVLTDSEQAVILGIATKAIHAAARDSGARHALASNIRPTGGGR